MSHLFFERHDMHVWIINYNYTAKSLKYDSAQNASDARREIYEERGVLSVRRSDEEIEATQ
jgi:hypothetical protein